MVVLICTFLLIDVIQYFFVHLLVTYLFYFEKYPIWSIFHFNWFINVITIYLGKILDYKLALHLYLKCFKRKYLNFSYYFQKIELCYNMYSNYFCRIISQWCKYVTFKQTLNYICAIL